MERATPLWGKKLNDLTPEQVIDRWWPAITVADTTVKSLIADRHVMSETLNIVRSNPRFENGEFGSNPSFIRCVQMWHGHSASIAIRRLVEVDDPRSASLARVLQEMQIRPDVYTVENLKRKYPASEESLMEQFSELGDASRRRVDPDRLKRDLAQLTDETREIRTFVNRHIAHVTLDSDRVAVPVTFDDVASAVTLVTQVAAPWIRLFQGNRIAHYDAPDDNRWLRVFDFAWREPKANADT